MFKQDLKLNKLNECRIRYFDNDFIHYNFYHSVKTSFLKKDSVEKC